MILPDGSEIQWTNPALQHNPVSLPAVMPGSVSITWSDSHGKSIQEKCYFIVIQHPVRHKSLRQLVKNTTIVKTKDYSILQVSTGVDELIFHET